jgi:hypothetical protein
MGDKRSKKYKNKAEKQKTGATRKDERTNEDQAARQETRLALGKDYQPASLHQLPHNGLSVEGRLSRKRR